RFVRSGEGVRDIGEMLANDVVEQRALHRIVVIKQRLGDARLCRDLGDRRPVEAVGREQARRHRKQRLALVVVIEGARSSHSYVVGLKSTTRLALPCERSIAPGSTTRTPTVTPMTDLMRWVSSCAPNSR